MIVLTVILFAFLIRHYWFTVNRFTEKQKQINIADDTDWPSVCVMVPMHNEEHVIANALNAILSCEYPQDKIQIIPINDHSEDSTKVIVDEFEAKYPDRIQVLHRLDPSQARGKPVALNDAIKLTDAEIILIFDADYQPAKDGIKKLVSAFEDPEVGAVMGRVVPYNVDTNILTRLLFLEREGGYQVDQQARYNLGLTPQYGGTNGGFRREVWNELGGFNPEILAEDTELTFRLYMKGLKVAYVNSAVCYEESPETWEARAIQIQRWSRGHNQVMFAYFNKVLFDTKHTFIQKVDALMTLLTYVIPFMILVGQPICLVLLWLGNVVFALPWILFLGISMFNSFGNFAPFFEIATACILDGDVEALKYLPSLIFSFFFYMWFISVGFIQALIDKLTGRHAIWKSTQHNG